jgi:hypothetical protein
MTLSTTILNKANELGFIFPNLNSIRLVLYEMIVNALYHSHGFTEQKLKRKNRTRKMENYVEVNYGCNINKIWSFYTDFNGKLSKSAFLKQ